MFENFFVQEWVQVSTAFAFLIVILCTPLMYWRVSRKLQGAMKQQFLEIAKDLYGTVFFLLIAPVGYLVLYFLGSQTKFMQGDPMAWICFAGGAAAIYDLARARQAWKSAAGSSGCTQRNVEIGRFARLTQLALGLSLIPLLYGIVMTAVTNLMNPTHIGAVLWFLTFLVTGLAVVYAVTSKSLLIVSQAYASNPKLGCRPK